MPTKVVGETLTHQSFKDECDINRIMEKYERTGVLEHAKMHRGQYGDFLSAIDYHDAMNAVLAANSMFESIPAGLRARFDNDPEKFLAFVQDPDNAQELVKMGLADRPDLPRAPDEDDYAYAKRVRAHEFQEAQQQPSQAATEGSGEPETG